ncbi:unnamed protein product [Dicrocoelium dendriticum]|nr:unnamed protein product [Dicrocoelium dendriticum]
MMSSHAGGPAKRSAQLSGQILSSMRHKPTLRWKAHVFVSYHNQFLNTMVAARLCKPSGLNRRRVCVESRVLA